MNITRAHAKELSAQFAASLAREPNEEVRANGMPIVKLFAEVASEHTTDEERAEILERALAYNLRNYEKTKARVLKTADGTG